MKTRSLIIIGIIVAIAISIMYVSFAYNQEIKLATGIMTSDKKPQSSMVSDPVCFVVDRTRSDNIGSGVTMDTCISLKQFEEMGCTKPMLEHLAQYSNLLDYESDGTWYLEFIGLPSGMSVEDFERCVDVIKEMRLILDSRDDDEPKTPADCRMKYGKVKQDVENCVETLGETLSPCTSDRTACFNQDENLCDPSGWECDSTDGIFEEIIENEN